VESETHEDDDRRIFELDPTSDPWETGNFVPPPPDLPEESTSWYPADLIDSHESVRTNQRWPLIVGAFLAALIGGLVAIGGVALFASLGGEETVEATPTTAPPTTVIERIRTEIVRQEVPAETAEAVAKKVVPSIVTVHVGNLVEGECQRFGSGSGVVLDDTGRIATNHHVVEDSDCQEVTFQDGRIYGAVLLGSDPLTDLAVIETEAAGLVPVELGTSADLNIGQITVAIGNPLGQAGGASLTVGVLSAVNREVFFGQGEAQLFGMLQTDAPITQGSSGGALVDIDGRLIGITSAIGVSTSGAEGIGYAIPVELVRRVTTEIIETGSVVHAFLGIEGADYFEERPDGARAPAGAMVSSVVEDTTAAELGLIDGDVIIRLDDQVIVTMEDLVISLRLYRAGQAVEFTVLRDGEPFTATAMLGERPENP